MNAKLLIIHICFLLLPPLTFAGNTIKSKELVPKKSEIINGGTLQRIWQNDEVYYERGKGGGSGIWSGLIYRYSLSKCFQAIPHDNYPEGIYKDKDGEPRIYRAHA